MGNPKSKDFWKKPRKVLGGFTLVEVALAIAIGLVIIAAAVIAFNVSKRNAITATQQNEAAAMKAIVETAVARGTLPQWTTTPGVGGLNDVQRGLFSVVETASTNPYTGTVRTPGASVGGYAACPLTTGGLKDLISPLGNPCAAGGSLLQGGFAYVYDISGGTKYKVTFADSTAKVFEGWAFVETDMAGNIVAASGGGTGTQAAATGSG